VDYARRLTWIAMCLVVAAVATRALRCPVAVGRERAVGGLARGVSEADAVVGAAAESTTKAGPQAAEGGRRRRLRSWMPRWKTTSAVEVEALQRMVAVLRRAAGSTAEARRPVPREGTTTST